MPSSSLVEVEVIGVGVRFRLDQFRYSLDSVKILFRLGLGGWLGRLFQELD